MPDTHSPTVAGLPTEAAIAAFEQAQPLDARVPATIHAQFVESAQQYGAAPALSLLLTGAAGETPLTWSHATLLARITQAANLFAELGGPGVGVAYLLPSLLETHAVLWGAETAGYAVPLNPLLEVEQLVALVAASGARILVTCAPELAPPLAAKGEAIRAQLPDLQVVHVGALAASAAGAPAVVPFAPALAVQEDDGLTFTEDTNPDRIVAYFHTGGTTGSPKLVAHTHRNQLCAALGATQLLAVQPGDVVTNGMPLFHVGGAIASSLAFFRAGAQVLTLTPQGLRNPTVVGRFWRIVEEHGVTVIGAVPTALAAILNVPLDADLRRVRCAMTGSASIPRTVAEGFTRLTGVSLHEILGMTESGGVTAIDPAGATPTMGAVGRRLPYTQLTVRQRLEGGRLGEVCTPGEIGALLVRGPHVSPGYRQPDGSLVPLAVDGVLDTGDLAYTDAAGKVFIAGRAKDLIIRSGHNIDPAMIEAAFLAHPEVQAAAAVGQIDAYAGELPVAYVVLRAGSSVSPEALAEFARARIDERPAWPRQVYVIEALPLTAVGKIYKPELRADAAQRVLAEVVAALAGEALHEVSVTPGGPRGLRARVQLHTAPSAELRAALDAALGEFILEAELHSVA